MRQATLQPPLRREAAVKCRSMSAWRIRPGLATGHRREMVAPESKAGLARLTRVLALILCFLSWEGFTTQVAGFGPIPGRMAVGAVSLILPLPFLLLPQRAPLWPWHHYAPAALFAYCTLVSFVANTYIFAYGPENWVPAMYYIAPILFYYVLFKSGYTVDDILDAVILAALVASAVIAVDQVFQFEILDVFYRLAFFDASLRRIVILKSETVLAFLLLLSRFISSTRIHKHAWASGASAVLMLYVLIVVSESRIGIATVILAIVMFACMGGVPKQRLSTLAAVGAFVVGPFLIFGAAKYINAFHGTTFIDYIYDYNVVIRLDSFVYFWEYFTETRGVGFGVMSTSPFADNFVSNGIPLAYNLVDLGWFGALVQFGIVGLLAVMALTAVLIRRLVRIARGPTHPRRNELLMTAAFVLASTLSPIPTNLFTLTHMVLLGSVLWCLPHRAAFEVGHAVVEPAERPATTRVSRVLRSATA
jgi:hypothetical protein